MECVLVVSYQNDANRIDDNLLHTRFVLNLVLASDDSTHGELATLPLLDVTLLHLGIGEHGEEVLEEKDILSLLSSLLDEQVKNDEGRSNHDKEEQQQIGIFQTQVGHPVHLRKVADDPAAEELPSRKIIIETMWKRKRVNTFSAKKALSTIVPSQSPIADPVTTFKRVRSHPRIPGTPGVKEFERKGKGYWKGKRPARD